MMRKSLNILSVGTQTLLLFPAVILILLSCPKDIPTSSVEIAITKWALSVDKASMVIATPRIEHDDICLSFGSQRFPPRPGSISALTHNILTFLNHGGDLLLIPQILDQWSFGRFRVILVDDIDADGIDEIMIAGGENDPLGDGDIELTEQQAFIFECVDGSYELMEPRSLGDAYFVDLEAVDQLSPNQQTVIVLYLPYMGNFEAYIALQWSGQAWQYLFSIGTLRGSLVVSEGIDGYSEFTFYQNTTGSVPGATPQHLITRFGWESGQMVELDEYLVASLYRVQVLKDAQIASDEGRLGESMWLYYVAYSSRELMDEPSIYEIDTGQDDLAHVYQSAFAFFRFIFLSFQLRGDDLASSIDSFYRHFPEGSPGSEFGEALELIHDQLDAGNTLTSACDAAMEKLSEKYPNLGGYNGHIGGWEFEEIQIDSSDFCPIVSSGGADQ